MTLTNASVSPSNLLMPFLILSDSRSLPHCLLPVTLVYPFCSANDSFPSQREVASTGEPSLCFIASHCKAGRLQPFSLLLMGVGVLFLQ